MLTFSQSAVSDSPRSMPSRMRLACTKRFHAVFSEVVQKPSGVNALKSPQMSLSVCIRLRCRNCAFDFLSLRKDDFARTICCPPDT